MTSFRIYYTVKMHVNILPLLFLILIGDIDQEVAHSFISSFADDTRIGNGIQTKEDASQLQQDLDKVYQWAIRNNMTFNDTKFDLIRYGQNTQLKEATSYTSNANTNIEAKSSTKDLGVTMSATAEFTEHIAGIVETVKDLTAWILQSFKSRSRCHAIPLENHCHSKARLLQPIVEPFKSLPHHPT